MDGDSALDPGHQQVPEPDVTEGSADHHLVVTTARAEGVKILALDAESFEIALRRTLFGNRSGRGDVIRGNGIPQQGKRPRIGDRPDGRHLGGEVGEKAGFTDVARLGVPLVDLPTGDGDRVPLFVTIEDVAVLLLKKVRGQRRFHDTPDLLLARPDVTQVDRLSI